MFYQKEVLPQLFLVLITLSLQKGWRPSPPTGKRREWLERGSRWNSKVKKRCFPLQVETNLKSRPAPAFERGISEFSAGPSEQCRMSQTDQQVAAFLWDSEEQIRNGAEDLRQTNRCSLTLHWWLETGIQKHLKSYETFINSINIIIIAGLALLS